MSPVDPRRPAPQPSLAFPCILLMLAACITGCSGQRGPKVEYVEGTVTLDGNPVEGASVGYSPVAHGQGLPAGGKTDPNGRYRLTAVRGGGHDAGTAVGDYSVSVTKMEFIPKNEPQPPPPSGWDPRSGAPPPPPMRPVVPLVYGDTATSGLRVTVKPGRNTGPEFSFDLDSEKPTSAGK